MAKETNDIAKGGIKNFKWSSLLSGFAEAKSKEERDTTIMSGLPGHVPYEKDMIREWEPPYLFFRLGILGLFLFLLIILAQYMFSWGNFLMVGIVPFIVPLVMLVFFWELNIPRNISMLDSIATMLFSGIACFYIVYFVISLTGTVYSEYVEPLVFGVTKLLLICVCLRKKSRGYGLNGVLIGAAVGAGYSAIITGEQIFELAKYFAGKDGFISAVILLCVFQIGADVVWTATFGGALALSKGKEKLSLKHFANSLFIICFLGTYLIELLWNFDLYGFFEFFIKLSDNEVVLAIYNFLEVYHGRYILLMLLSWALLLFVARKCIVESYRIAEKAKAEEKRVKANFNGKAGKTLELYALSGKLGGKKFTTHEGAFAFGRAGNCNVCYEENTKGISGNHCKIYKSGSNFVIVDQNSSYGTFLADGTRLEPGKEYSLRDGMEFYLAAPENRFKVALPSLVSDEQEKNLLNIGRRTNEPKEAEDGHKVYIAVAILFAVIFLVMYFISGGSGLIASGEKIQIASEQGVEGAWRGETFDVKNLLLQGIDNIGVSLEIGIFKESYANGLTFTQDGKAYATYNGRSIDYAVFDYSIIDDNTIHIQWDYEMASVNLGVSLYGVLEAGVEKAIDEQTGYDAKYQIESDGTMAIDFFGENLVMAK